jgi:hypothetical protein
MTDRSKLEEFYQMLMNTKQKITDISKDVNNLEKCNF